jgi:PAS domain S-box-containing protein
MANDQKRSGETPRVKGFPVGEGQAVSSAAHEEAQLQMFRSLADHSQEFIGLCDLEFKPFYVNEAGRRLVGLGSVEEACAVKVQDYFFPEDHVYIHEEFFPKVMREGKAEMEIRFRHFKTGAALWMIWNVFQVRDSQGKVSGYATVSRDITERKRAERIGGAGGCVPPGAFVPARAAGPKFIFEFANEAYYGLVGHRDLIGRPAFEAMPEAAEGATRNGSPG